MTDGSDLGGHGEQSGHAEGHSGGHWAIVKPEADPGHDH